MIIISVRKFALTLLVVAVVALIIGLAINAAPTAAKVSSRASTVIIGADAHGLPERRQLQSVV
jgi:hypothetical protein